MELKKPFNLQKWIDENRHLLKPPVGNKNCIKPELHCNDSGWTNVEKIIIIMKPKTFYQIEGDIIVKTQQNGELVQYDIKEGEMFLLPGKFLILQ